MVWDRGTWAPDKDPRKAMQKGQLDFELHGEKLNGHWHLVRMRKRPGLDVDRSTLLRVDTTSISTCAIVSVPSPIAATAWMPPSR